MSGINILRRLLLREAAKDSGQASGILSIGDSVRKLAERKLDSYIISAKKQGIDLDAMNEQQLKYILELNKPKNKIKVISQGDPEFENIMNQMLGKKKTADVYDLKGKKIKDTRNIMGGEEFDLEKGLNDLDEFNVTKDAAKAKKAIDQQATIDNIINKINNMESISSIKEMNKVIKREGKYKNLTDQDVDKIFKATEDRTSGRLDEIDPDDYDPYQTGGRVGLKSGMSRRGFLKLMGGVGVGIGALKSGVLKMFGKEGAEQVTKEIVRTPNVPGKPEWFDSLVNKVITQGDDVSKNFAVQDRQVVHRVLLDKDGKAIDAKTADKIKQEGNVYDVEDITVTRNLDDGEIRVTYYSDKNMGAGDVELIYKPGQADEMTKGKPPDTFQAAEAEPRVTNYDGDIEYDGENLVNNIDDLYSDTNKLKQFATNQKPTMKEFIESKKKQEIVEEVNSSDVGATEYLSNKYGDPIYQEPDIDPPEFASGGRVGLFLGGGLTAGKGVVREFIKKLAKEKGMSGAQMMKVLNPKAYQKFLEDPSLYKKYNPKTGLMATDEVKKFMKETEVARGDQLERLIEMIKTRRGTNENIEEMIRNAVRETGAPREEIEPLIRSMISMKAGRTGEGIIPSNVSEEALLEMEQMLKNIRTRDRQLNAGGGLAYMLGE